MKYFNLFYIAIIAVGLTLFALLRPEFHSELSFYGFAESNETEINYNHPVMVDRILISPGQEVTKGDTLMHLSRLQSKETLVDQTFKIAELKAEESIWRQKKNNQIEELELERNEKISDKNIEIKQLENEIKHKRSLAEGLKTITPTPSAYQPLEEKITQLKHEINNVQKSYEVTRDHIKKDLELGDNPFRQQINRLEAERAFDESQKIQQIAVTAPSDGLIGNISCKEEEHIPSYTTLLSFYEPHSGVIKGYVHEDLTLEVNLGDRFWAASLKDPGIRYEGQVIGLGSRIVEIPSRLRKIQGIKSYGREVLIEITKDNIFLQKEKVSISVQMPGSS